MQVSPIMAEIPCGVKVGTKIEINGTFSPTNYKEYVNFIVILSIYFTNNKTIIFNQEPHEGYVVLIFEKSSEKNCFLVAEPYRNIFLQNVHNLFIFLIIHKGFTLNLTYIHYACVLAF